MNLLPFEPPAHAVPGRTVVGDGAADVDVLAGLRAKHKHVPPRLLAEAAPPELRDRLARDEQALLARFLPALAASIGAPAHVLEPWAPTPPRTYALLQRLASADASPGPTLVALLDDTLALLAPAAARAVLRELHAPDRCLLLSADGTREHADTDPFGPAAALAEHVLLHINATHAATFDPAAFDYHAAWNAAASRVEETLVSARAHHVRVAGERIAFAAGESLTIAHRHKHTPAALQALVVLGGWRMRAELASEQRPLRLWLCDPL